MSLKNVSKGYGSRSIYDGLDFAVRRRERWCVMGINGAGKSTLLKLVAGATEPDDGTVAVGGSVKMGYFAQHAMELLDGERTGIPSRWRTAFPQAGQGSLRALAGCFGFSGDDVEEEMPGAVGRREGAAGDGADALRPAETFWCWTSRPTIWTWRRRRCSIAALSDYEGTMLFVSHDRHFLAALVQSRAGTDA